MGHGQGFEGGEVAADEAAQQLAVLPNEPGA